MDITANKILTQSWLKFTYMLLFTTCVVTCIHHNVPEGLGVSPVP